MQHAIGSWPDPAHGYCVGRRSSGTPGGPAPRANAGLGSGRAERLARIAIPRRRFRRVKRPLPEFPLDRRLIDRGPRLGRQLRPGGALVGRHHRDGPRSRAGRRGGCSCQSGTAGGPQLTSPRAEASVVLGCAAILDSNPGGRPAAMFAVLATRLQDRFRRHSTPDWPWPEVSVTYENALLPRALIVAGRILESEPMVHSGLHSIDWLIDAQTAPKGHLFAGRERVVAAWRRHFTVRPAADRGDGAAPRRGSRLRSHRRRAV